MAGAISDEEFNAIINGPLDHPLYPFKVSRLILALRAVVDETGEMGAQALRKICKERQNRDQEMDGY